MEGKGLLRIRPFDRLRDRLRQSTKANLVAELDIVKDRPLRFMWYLIYRYFIRREDFDD